MSLALLRNRAAEQAGKGAKHAPSRLSLQAGLSYLMLSHACVHCTEPAVPMEVPEPRQGRGDDGTSGARAAHGHQPGWVLGRIGRGRRDIEVSVCEAGDPGRMGGGGIAGRQLQE